jgi:type IV pilus assembly protein PilP
MANLIRVLMLIMAFSLAGCQQEKDDLAAYVANVKAKERSDIEPIPVMKTYEKYAYSSAELRDPFVPTVVEVPVKEEKKIVDNGIRPKEHRLKEALESYPLSDLQFVGTLEQETLWALIRASDGVISRVQVGNYLGENHGKILAISETELLLKEIVPDIDSGGYIERDSSLSVVDVN